MPIFYYISFSYNKDQQTLSIKDLTDIKPLKDPHLCFMYSEIRFLLGGQWDLWIRPIIKDNKLRRIERELSSNIATSHKLPELYNMLMGYTNSSNPEKVLLPKVEKMRQEYIKQ